MLGEQAGRGDPQQPATAAGLADLEDRAVLQAEHLRGPAGQPQAAGGEGETGRGADEQLVAELLAQLPDVQRDRGLRHRQLGCGLLHRAQPHHRGEGAQLGRRHTRPLVWVGAATYRARSGQSRADRRSRTGPKPCPQRARQQRDPVARAGLGEDGLEVVLDGVLGHRHAGAPSPACRRRWPAGRTARCSRALRAKARANSSRRSAAEASSMVTTMARRLPSAPGWSTILRGSQGQPEPVARDACGWMPGGRRRRARWRAAARRRCRRSPGSPASPGPGGSSTSSHSRDAAVRPAILRSSSRRQHDRPDVIAGAGSLARRRSAPGTRAARCVSGCGEAASSSASAARNGSRLSSRQRSRKPQQPNWSANTAEATSRIRVPAISRAPAGCAALSPSLALSQDGHGRRGCACSAVQRLTRVAYFAG